jgi:oxygen-independent coproporphyrinogen-3 oxidase
LGALAGELSLLEKASVSRLSSTLETIYVGGGTPSLLGAEAMAGLARVLGPGRLQGSDLEWTAEANPESFSREVAGGWIRAGVNRISLGAQSFQEEPLKWMGRLHGPGGPANAVQRARKVGFENINLDLIFGLPAEAGRDWNTDLETALAMELPHLSLYGLTIEPGTPLGKAVAEGRVGPVEEPRYREEFLEASERFRDAGYRQYELSNFCLPGFEAQHNQVYWNLRPYLGLGNAAHSFQPPVRRWNLRGWEDYQQSVAKGRLPTAGSETLGPADTRLETLWLGLRTDDGLRFDVLPQEAKALFQRWSDQGWAVPTSGGFRLTPEGWLLLDQLVVELDGIQKVHPSPS